MKTDFLKRRELWTVLLSVMLIAVMAVALPAVRAWADEGAPQPGTVAGVVTYTFYPATVLTSGTSYSASPYSTVAGGDVTQVKAFNAVDVFVTVDISDTGTITVTPQVSADRSNWTNATYTYIADTLAETTSVVTSTGEMTATSTLSSSSTPTEKTYQIVMTADGTDYLRLPIAGEYLRFKIERSGTLTPTIKATLRNN